jgi:hypothetical protein
MAEPEIAALRADLMDMIARPGSDAGECVAEPLEGEDIAS